VTSSSLQPLLTRFGPSSNARRRLVCLPYAGGTPATYRLWPQSLPDDVEVVTVRLPGREPPFRDPPPDSIEAIVGCVLTALDRSSDLPFAVFGHSMGALVAYEVTLALEAAAGMSPEVLFVSSRRAPDEPSVLAPIHELPDHEFVDAVQERYNAVPAVIRGEPDLLALLLPTLRADIRAFETYRPLTGRKVRCPIHVFGGSDDRHPRPEQLAQWQRVAEREVRVRVFDGDHFYLTNQREALTGAIADAWQHSSGALESS
jgi:medium-chain acyl-[acyl-carrier-protein] hydrolase